MFGEQAIRLLRESWGNATLLAEELYAMFQNDIPISHSAPVTFSNFNSARPALTIDTNTNTGVPPLQLRGPDGTSASISITGGSTTFTNNSTGNVVNIENITGDNIVGGGSGVGGGGGSGNTFIGTVQGGTGTTYTVLLDNGDTVTATVPGILGSEQVPSGNSYPVVQTDSNVFQMYVPLWVE